jgi:hypothetical protein
MGEVLARMKEMRNAFNILIGKPEWKRLFRRHRRRLKDDIKMDIKEIGYEALDSNHLVLDSDQWRALINMY